MPGGLDILMDQGFQPTLFAEERWSRPVTRSQRPNDLLKAEVSLVESKYMLR